MLNWGGRGTEIYKNSVINMGTEVYNKLPGFITEIDDGKVFNL